MITHNLDRALRILHNGFCDAAEQESNEAAVSMRAHHDKVGVPSVSLFDDAGSGVTFHGYPGCEKAPASKTLGGGKHECLGSVILTLDERFEISNARSECKQIDDRKHTHLGLRRPES